MMRVRVEPKISVLMSVYQTDNAFLKEAIESILNQSFLDFEFIIVNDCTNEENLKCIESYHDPRIRLIHNRVNSGLTKSLNNGLAVAKGKYIARMDSDDVSLPDRLERQFAYMETHQDLIVLGGYACELSGDKMALSRIEDFEVMKMRMIFFDCALIHPTAFLNNNLLQKFNLKYDETVKKAQDYMLWSDCIQFGEIDVLNEVVLYYRLHAGQITNTCSGEQQKCAMMVQKKLLKQLLNIEATEEMLKLHYSIIFGKVCAPISSYSRNMKMLIQKNKQAGVFNKKYFDRECCYIWLMMTIKGIVHFHDFRGICSSLFWKAVIHVNYWGYYYKYFVESVSEEKRAILRIVR